MNAVIEQTVALLAADQPGAAADLLRGATREMPLDSNLYILQGVAAQAVGDHPEAFRQFWRALAAEPAATGARLAIAEAVLAEQTTDMPKDFSLNSGERQTAPQLKQIRADHRARYAAAARWLRGHFDKPRLRCGLDAFSGNGYGSRMLADLAGCRMVGIDGSYEATQLAERHYASHRIVFRQAFFPFDLTHGLFDFAISLESVEHVDAPQALLRQLAQATDGPLIISVPCEETLPFARNADLFAHHTRHFTRREIHALLAEVGRPTIAAEWGQEVYRLDHGRLNGLLPASAMGMGPVVDTSQFLLIAATA